MSLSRRPARIPPSVISGAAAGSIPHLWDLVGRATTQNATTEIVRLSFTHFTVECPRIVRKRDQLTAELKRQEERAFVGLIILSRLAERYDAELSPSVTEEFVKGFQDSVGVVSHWIKFYLRIGGLPVAFPETGTQVDLRYTHVYQCEMLGSIERVDPRIRQAFFSSLAFCDLMAFIWLAKTREGEVYMDIEGRGPGDPVVYLMRALLEDDVGRETFLRAVTSRRTAVDFASATLQRIQKAQALPPSEDVFRFIGQLTQITDRVSQNSTMFSRAFARVGYIQPTTSAINALSIAAVNAGRPHLLKFALEVTIQFMIHIQNLDTHILKNRRQLVAGDVISVMARIVGYLARNGPPSHVEPAIDMIQLLAPYTTYPSIVMEFDRMLPPKIGLTEMPRDSKIFPVWQAYWVSFSRRHNLYTKDDAHVMNICDNPSCTGTLQHSWISKGKCSRCHSMIYCSAACQEEDWKERHHKECSYATEDHSACKSSGTCYDLLSRLYHNKLVAALCDEAFSIMKEEKTADAPPSTIMTQFMDFNFPIAQVSMVPVDIDSSQWWRAYSQIELTFPQEYLLPRVTSMGRDPRLRVEGGDVRLVESEFPLGYRNVVRLTALVKRTEKGHVVLYSVPRYGHSTEVAGVHEVSL
ncbi:hypothetical protein DFP72DRAFT_467962 [Ephemerocybe angulata]|uniref:phytol kinase n=1 Tax=Ephemerocybe angulata TaxID=980116 RepID=A0A8H6HUB0_9AGAR|nr:hypothetical protein DFP72DRAFT_467962 [Tulosesus angulatus]